MTERSAGRPRNEQHDDAILGATIDLVSEVGIAALTIDAVAKRAGVGKATIYRRWASKEALLLDAWVSVVALRRSPTRARCAATSTPTSRRRPHRAAPRRRCSASTSS